MSTIRGWLFFSRSKNRVTFVPEDTRYDIVGPLAWYVLQDDVNWRAFLEHFSLKPHENDGGFQVYLKEDAERIKTWLGARKDEPETLA